MSTITKDLGAVTAYAYAVEQGYTGTEEEYAELMASYATVGQTAVTAAQTATEKAQQASASATSASQSADTASASATSAQASATTATTKASEAQQSAQTATTRAQEASQSASTASQSASTAVQAKQDAQTAKTASETAQANAESARDEAESARDTAQQYAESIDPEKLIGAYPVDTATGAIASFTDGADNIPMKKVTVRIEPKQAGSGDPSPDNVRPISGWDSVAVEQTASVSALTIGTISDASGEEGSSSTKIRTDFIAVSHLESIDLLGAEREKLRAIHYYDAQKTWIKAKYFSAGYDIPKTSEFDEPEIYAYIKLVFQHVNNTETESADGKLAVVNYSTYPIPLPQTVYGGELDVTNGVLTVDRAFIASYNGETLPPEWISDRDVYSAGATPTTGAQVVYNLATPITLTLTPTEIKSLLGDNNLWADTGDTEAVYRADTTLYINKKIAEAVSALS